MKVELNHTIVADVVGLEVGAPWGPFQPVALSNGTTLEYLDSNDVHPQQDAFLIDDEDFDAVFGHVRAAGVTYYADPFLRQPGEINEHYGGRGVYFHDPDGHLLEVVTRPYGPTPE